MTLHVTYESGRTEDFEDEEIFELLLKGFKIAVDKYIEKKIEESKDKCG